MYRCIFAFFVFFISASPVLAAGCGVHKVLLVGTQRFDSSEFLYTSKTDYDALVRDKSHKLAGNSLIYECDVGVMAKSSACDGSTFVLAEPGWVWKGKELSERTLFVCTVGDKPIGSGDTWVKVALVNEVKNKRVRSYPIKNKSGVTCVYDEVHEQAKCSGLAVADKKCGGQPEGTVLAAQECDKNIIKDPAAKTCKKICEFRKNPDRMVWSMSIETCSDTHKLEGGKCVKKTAVVESNKPKTTSKKATTINVSGVVVDKKTNEPLPGATVGPRDDISKSVASDIDGKFVLKAVPVGTIIQVSYVGFETYEIAAKENLKIALNEDIEEL